VEIDLGGPDDGCEYNGRTFAGAIVLGVVVDPPPSPLDGQKIGRSCSTLPTTSPARRIDPVPQAGSHSLTASKRRRSS
jgi:hypothetical protein